MIDFELSPNIQSSRQMIHMVAEQLMRLARLDSIAFEASSKSTAR